MSDDDDPLLADLRRLDGPKPDDLLVERTRRRARRALALGQHPATRLWRGVLVPAAVASTVVLYLFFAFHAAAALY